MLPDPANLLLCPVCRRAFSPSDGGAKASRAALVCSGGHSFDVAKQGYFNLLVGKGTAFESDTAEMVAARFDFLGGGHYRPLATSIIQAALPALTAPSPVVLDSGTGTGHYLRLVLDAVQAVNPAALAIALDISKFALRRAARMNPGAINLVSDVWQPLPVADAAVDVVMVIFAPRNVSEFARILRPGGRLVVVTPRPGHLAEIAGQTGMLGIEPAKEERLAESLVEHFVPLQSTNLDLQLTLSAKDVANLAFMGPAGHHLDRGALFERTAGLSLVTEVSAKFRISVFERRTPEQR